MTTVGGDVSYTISARDRASVVMQRVGRNMNVMQRNVATLTTAMGVMDRTTGGVLRSLSPMLGHFTVAGLAISGMSLALGVGLKKLKETRDEQRKTSEASQRLRNNFMLSGFSAFAARSSVEELRGSLSKLAFQTLPKLDFEMQGFLLGLDTTTKIRFDGMANALHAAGVDMEVAEKAIVEAMQGNFGPINELLKGKTGPITTFGEFAAAMAQVKESVTISKDPILRAFEDLVGGAGTFEERLKTFLVTLRNNPKAAAESMATNVGIIRGILLGLNDEETALLERGLDTWQRDRSLPVQAQAAARLLTPILMGLIGDIRKVGDNHEFLQDQVMGTSTTYAERWIAMADATNQQANRIVTDADRAAEALRKIDEALRTIQEMGKEAPGGPTPPNLRGRGGMFILPDVGGPSVGRTPTPPQSRSQSSESTNDAWDTFEANLATAAAEAAAQGFSQDFIDAFSDPTARFQHGAIITRPMNARVGEVPEMIAPLSRLPSLLEGIGGGGKTIHISLEIGGQVWRDLVINTLNDEVSLREPSLGLG